MKKRLSVLLVTALLSVAAVGCGGGSSKTADTPAKDEKTSEAKDEKKEEASSGEKYTIKLGHGAAEAVAMHKGALKFKEVVEASSNGRITVEIYPNQMLGADRELTEATQMGNIQMSIPSSSPVANFVPEIYLFDTPFAFKSRESAFKILDSEVGENILASLSKVGLKGLAIWENGFRDMTCNGGPKTTPEQLKGLKIRTMENDVHLELWRALGANPTPMAFGELYTGLQQKTVDAQENPLLLIYETKYQEVQDTVVETRHIFTPYLVLINEEFYNGLPKEDQDIIQNAVKEATVVQRDLAAKGEDEAREKLKAVINVVELTDEERQVFVDKTKYIYDMVKEKSQNPDLADQFFKALEAQ